MKDPLTEMPIAEIDAELQRRTREMKARRNKPGYTENVNAIEARMTALNEGREIADEVKFPPEEPEA